jgi:hypothetical protein
MKYLYPFFYSILHSIRNSLLQVARGVLGIYGLEEGVNVQSIWCDVPPYTMYVL